MAPALRSLGLVILLTTCLAPFVGAQIQMPDPKQMSGIPLPINDLPDGTISVRVIRGQLSNNIPNQAVDLLIGNRALTERTDESGRAQYSGIPAGTTVKAVTIVGGERVESQEFQVPARGGIRVMLVATDGSAMPPATTPPNAEPQRGPVALGGDSRVVIELSEDALRVFYLFDIINGAQVPVTPPSALVFDMPTSAQSTGVLPGSTLRANARGARVTVPGPFPPGRSTLEIGYGLPFFSGQIALSQTLPVALDQLAVIVQKVGDMTVESQDLATRREMPVEGRTYIIAGGPAIPAGRAFTLELGGLPHHGRLPRNIALGLALAIVGIGFAFAHSSRGQTAAPRRQKLAARRELLFSQLVKLEEQRHAGNIETARYEVRRSEIVAQLERVYAALDEGVAA